MLEQQKITLILTSCNRPDLLKRTLDSFLVLNKYPIHRYLIHEDSDSDYPFLMHLPSEVFDLFRVFNSDGIGLSKSLDFLYSKIINHNSEIDYVFTCEDDWQFEGNPNFIADSIAIMQADPTVNHVWIRHANDHGHPLGPLQTIGGISCREVLKGYAGGGTALPQGASGEGAWGGFSFNPGVKRISDYKRVFPQGFSQFGDEIECSKHANTHNWRAVALEETACKHIGYNRHTPNFKN